VSIATSASTTKTAGGITLSVGASASGQGGGVSLTGGSSTAGVGGNVNLNAGTGKIAGGSVKMLSARGLDYLSVADKSINLAVGEEGQISLTIPTTEDLSTATSGSMIAFGFNTTTGPNYNFRLQSGAPSPLLIASAPLQVTLVQYSSDVRIKTDIQAVDEEALLQRLQCKV
jgi:hypothetical protein